MEISFRAQDKVSSHEKLIFKNGVQLLFLFVLMDVILLNLDLQKRTMWDIVIQGKTFPRETLKTR